MTVLNSPKLWKRKKKTVHEMGFNSDWVEKCLAHEERSSRSVYNKAEFEAQRRHMAQQWSDAVDAWEADRPFTPVLAVPEGQGPVFDPRAAVCT